MKRRKVLGQIGEFFDVMGSAIAVSNAVRERRPARKADLENLGIDPQRFRQIRFR